MGRMTFESKRNCRADGMGSYRTILQQEKTIKEVGGLLFGRCLWLYLLVSVSAKFRASPFNISFPSL